MIGVPHGNGYGPITPSNVWRGVWNITQMTNFVIPNNVSFIKYALNSVPGLADVEVPHGDWDGPRAPPRCLGGLEIF